MTALVLSASSLLSGTSVLPMQPEADCRLLHAALGDGIEAALWSGRAHRPFEMMLHDDSDRIHFTHAALGRAECCFDGGLPGHRHVLDANSASINFNPGRRGWFRQDGPFESVTVMVRPDVFEAWACDVSEPLRQAIASGGCFVHGPGSAELRSTAQSLGRALAAADACPDDARRRSTVWLLGQALATVGLVLESHATMTDGCTCHIGLNERTRLLRARDRLLSDLSTAPTIPQLARDVGLSVLKLKRGFRQVFDHSVYGLFQSERMHEARRRLCAEGKPVMVVASELGYTNASHFAAAFQKQFGVRPSSLKRRA